MSLKPITQYTKSGSINIAYQVFGSGSMDFVYIPGWISNIDLMWTCPELVHFLLELGKTARVILFDKRGTGLSDRIVEFSTLEERMDDIRAVMDAVGSQRAVLFGHSEGGSVSALFAATYPERTISLITFGIFAKRRYTPEYPWAPTDKERQVLYDMIERSWGSGDMNLESLAPSKADDKVFMEWLASYFRSGASPSAALVLTKMNTQVDIIDILSSIKVPTLIMQRTHDIDVKIEEGKFIAERIRNSKFVEFEGRDHLFWAGNSEVVLLEIKEFLKEVTPDQNHEEKLFTIVAGRFMDDSAQTDGERLVKELIEKAGGSNILFYDNQFISTFSGASRAVHCGMDLVNFMKSFSIDISVVTDMRVSNPNSDQLLSPESMDFIDLLLNSTLNHQTFVTQAVRYLLSGTDIQFSEFEPVVSDHYSTILYKVADPYGEPSDYNGPLVLRRDLFLEGILQVIEANYDNEDFNVDMLCKEVGISERHLQRKIKAVTNKSPNQLISSVRLHKAKELLSQSTNNISQVAYMTGFNNPSYFAKCFKREFGKSPSKLIA
ncbi:MAG: alpha/beta fold hydrolase [Cyclobacteriaceae bacterium]